MKLYRNAIILVVIVALLGGAYYYFSNRKTSSGDEDTSTETVKLTEFTSDKVESVTLANQDGTFTIVPKGTDWTVSSPADFKADSSVLSSIVINAGSLTADKLVEENAKDLSVYGLDKPIAVTAKLKDGKEISVEIGNLTPTKSGYYVKLSEENKVYVVDSYTCEKLVVRKNDMRSKELYTVTSDIITKISMERKGQNVFSAAKSADGNWSLTQPIKGNVNTAALTPMLDALAATKASSFVSDNPSDLAEYGLDKPSYAFDFDTTTAGAFRLMIGAEKTKGSEYYAKLDGRNDIFVMDSTAYNFLDKPLTEIVDVFAYLVNIDQVTKIDLTMDGKTTNMTLDVYKDADGKTDNDKDKFTVNGQDASGKDKDDKQPFRTFYQSLIGITLDEIDVNGKPAGSPEISIKYTLKSAPGTMTVDFIPKDANYYYVVKNGEYSGLLVKKSKKDMGIQGMKDSYKAVMDFIAAKK